MSNRSRQSGRSGDPVYWAIAIGLLITGFAAPVGIIMIVLKLLGGKKRGRHPYYVNREEGAYVGARTTTASNFSGSSPGEQASRSAPGAPVTGPSSPLAQLSKSGKTLTRVGAIISAVLAFIIIASLSDASYWLLNG